MNEQMKLFELPEPPTAPLNDRSIWEMYLDGYEIERIVERCKSLGYYADGELRKGRPRRHVLAVIYNGKMKEKICER